MVFYYIEIIKLIIRKTYIFKSLITYTILFNIEIVPLRIYYTGGGRHCRKCLLYYIYKVSDAGTSYEDKYLRKMPGTLCIYHYTIYFAEVLRAEICIDFGLFISTDVKTFFKTFYLLIVFYILLYTSYMDLTPEILSII